MYLYLFLNAMLFEDVNDNVPFFTSSIYEATVTEGAQMGTVVLQVSAHDKDLDLNGKVWSNLPMFLLCMKMLFKSCLKLVKELFLNDYPARHDTSYFCRIWAEIVLVP